MTRLRDILLFVVFDEKTKLPKFTKYNFDFEKYAQNKKLTTSSKFEIFTAFLKESGNNNYDKVFTAVGFEEYFKFDSLGNIDESITNYINKYGTTIHDNYITTKGLDSYIKDIDQLVEDQFNLINYTDEQIRFVQDYIYTMDSTGNMFTKYNFNFNLYSTDFKVWGSKLNIFTDFVVRCYTLSGAFPSSFGYGLPDNFKKFFINKNELNTYLTNNNVNTDLITYMSKYAITSDLTTSLKNTNNIDFNSYKSQLYPSLSFIDLNDFKDYFYSDGQFEIATFNLNKQNTETKNVFSSVCTVFALNGNSFGTGFLFKMLGDNNVYILTCYHTIKSNSNFDILKVSLNNTENDINTIAEFDIIGYNVFIDVAIAKFNPDSEYNIINGVENLNGFDTITLSGDKITINNRDILYYIGNLGSDNDNSILEGTVIDNNYSGSFVNNFIVSNPDSILINTNTTNGFSGSPVFHNTSNKLVGMYNAAYIMDSGGTSAHVIQSSYLYTVAVNIITNWNYFSKVYANNKVYLSYVVKLSTPMSWLGTIMSYYNPIISNKKYKSLCNFGYNGGLVIENFIYGFDIVKKTFVTDPQSIGMFNVINLETPLLNTQIYKRYIESSRSPIVIKSMTYYNSLTNEFDKITFGKYGNQQTYSIFSFGFRSISQTILNKDQFPGKTFASSVYSTFSELKINYFYFNGSVWINEDCVIGGSDDSWHTLTTDNYGISYFQSKFSYPYVLYPYMSPYYESKNIGGNGEFFGANGEFFGGNGEFFGGNGEFFGGNGEFFGGNGEFFGGNEGEFVKSNGKVKRNSTFIGSNKGAFVKKS